MGNGIAGGGGYERDMGWFGMGGFLCSDCWNSLAVLRNPPGSARYPLGQKSGCTRFLHVSQPDLKPLSYLNIPIVHPRASDARASAYAGYDRSVICPALACVRTALAVGGFVGGFAALSRRLLDKA